MPELLVSFPPRDVKRKEDTKTQKDKGKEKDEKEEEEKDKKKKKKKQEEDEKEDMLPGTIVEKKEERSPLLVNNQKLLLPSLPSFESLDIKKVRIVC